MAEDPYSHAIASGLKLKKDIKKKKKKKDNKIIEQVNKMAQTEDQKPDAKLKTKAELAFVQQQEKMQTKRILEKANLTHKERVEKFNQHLDSLTEHFDIPKVSWTK